MRLATSSLLLPLTRPATAPHQPCYCPSPTLLLPLTCPATAPHPPCPSPTLLLPLTNPVTAPHPPCYCPSPALLLPLTHPAPHPPCYCPSPLHQPCTFASRTLHLPPPSIAALQCHAPFTCPPPHTCSAAVSCTPHLPPPSHLQRCSVMRKPRDEPAERKVGRQAMHLGGGAHGGSSSFSSAASGTL